MLNLLFSPFIRGETLSAKVETQVLKDHAACCVAEAISSGNRFIPDFDSALIRYNLLDAIQRASDQGAAQPVEGLPDG